MKTITDIPGLKDILDDCSGKVSALIGAPVRIHYSLKFNRLNTEDLITIICDVCEVKWDDIVKQDRKIAPRMARQFYCYFAYAYQKKQLVTIAHRLQRDHTTVIHGRDRIITMVETNDELYMPYFIEIKNRIEKIINSEPEVKP